MNIQELQDKVANAATKVEKIKGTIQKHEASATKKLQALEKQGITLDNMKSKYNESPYEIRSEILNYESKLDDIKGATRKLKDAEAVLANWETKLDVEVEKERFMNDNAPEVIKEFLEQWKQRVYEWCVEAYPKYVEEKKTFQTWEQKAKDAYMEQNPKGRTWSTECEKFVKQYLKDNDIKPTYINYPSLVKLMANYYNEKERLTMLEKTLEDDKKAKMMDLIYRVNAVVGSITDAKGLSIDPKGNLNGLVIGTKGVAKVETIGAGGYNIQVFHFRTLVHEYKGAK